MTTLQIDAANAKKLYKTAAPEFKAMLNDTFGEKYFIDKITDRVKTFEDACRELGFSHKTLLREYEDCDYSSDEIAYAKLKIIAQALNEGWKPNWRNSSEYKWYPYFDLSSSSSVVYDCAAGWSSGSYVGSRLCFKSRELAEYAGRQFVSIYQDLMLMD